MYLDNTNFTPEQREIILTNALTLLAAQLAVYGSNAKSAREIAQDAVDNNQTGLCLGALDPDKIEAAMLRFMRNRNAQTTKKEAA